MKSSKKLLRYRTIYIELGRGGSGWNRYAPWRRGNSLRRKCAIKKVRTGKARPPRETVECRKPRPGTSLITMVFVGGNTRTGMSEDRRIYSVRLNYTLLLLSGAHRRGQGLRERPGADAWGVHRQRQVYISVAR